MKITRVNVSDEISTWLTGEIKSGRFKPGEKLPSVEQLAEDLSVGRSSVREALRRLEAFGLVTLKQGSGTYVNAQKVLLGSSLTSFSQAIRQRGMTPGSVLLQRDVVEPDKVIQQDLKLSRDEMVNHLRRLRLADGEPLVIETSYLPHRLFPDLLDGPWSLDSSLYELLASRYNVRPAYATQNISAALLDEDQAQLLQVETGAPSLVMVTIAYAADGTPIESSLDIYRADRYQYSVTLVSRE